MSPGRLSDPLADEADRRFAGVVAGFLAHGAETGTELAACLAADPRHVMALVAKGFFQMLLSRSEPLAVAVEAARQARAALTEMGGSMAERLYVTAVEEMVAGRPRAAVDRLEAVLEVQPFDALAVKLIHAVLFQLGDLAGMHASIGKAMARWSDEVPHCGQLLGCHAFTLEEGGEYKAARATGERGVALDPRNPWGIHAVAHVFLETGDHGGGLDWLAQFDITGLNSNNFRYHMHWHKALYLLAQGRMDAVLDLYDAEVRKDRTDDYRDIANGASLLWRLELKGVPVGDRWQEMADIAERRIGEHCLVFADLHYLLALLGAGRWEAADTMLRTLERLATAGKGEQARMAREAGVAVAQGLVAFRRGNRAAADRAFRRAVGQLLPLGGSHAQRDVFQLTARAVSGTCPGQLWAGSSAGEPPFLPTVAGAAAFGA